MPGAQKHDDQVLYRERVLPSTLSFLPAALVVPSLALTFAPFSWLGGLVAGVVLYALILTVMVATAPVIELTGQEFRVSNATIPNRFLGSATAIVNKQEKTAAIRTELSALAYLRLQASVPALVKVEITDAKDPTPYWLFSTRNPERVLSALAQVR